MRPEQENISSDGLLIVTSYTERVGNNLVLSGLLTLTLQLLFFFLAVILRLQRIKDVSGGLSFVAVALLSLLFDLNHPSQMVELQWKSNRRPLVGTGLCCMWGLRLAGYLLARNIRMGKKSEEYNHQDSTLCKHISYWTFQAVWVFVVSLPVVSLNSSRPHENHFKWTVLDIIGLSLFSVGFTFEMITDQQKFNWKFYSMGNKGLWVAHRLWSWSRHPNYFFEILVWWGLFVLSTHVLQGIAWISVISPLFVMCILLFVSGLPVVEAASDEKYAKYEDYREYKMNTSILIPIPPELYIRIPHTLKCTVLLDFPIYNHMKKYETCHEEQQVLPTAV